MRKIKDYLEGLFGVEIHISFIIGFGWHKLIVGGCADPDKEITLIILPFIIIEKVRLIVE